MCDCVLARMMYLIWRAKRARLRPHMGHLFFYSWVASRILHKEIVRGFPRKLPKFTCFLVNNLGGKKMGRKRRFLTCRIYFALISRVFIRWSCIFTWMSTMHITFFRLLFSDLQKCLKKNNCFPEKNEASLRRVQVFFLSIFS